MTQFSVRVSKRSPNGQAKVFASGQGKRRAGKIRLTVCLSKENYDKLWSLKKQMDVFPYHVTMDALGESAIIAYLASMEGKATPTGQGRRGSVNHPLLPESVCGTRSSS